MGSAARLVAVFFAAAFAAVSAAAFCAAAFTAASAVAFFWAFTWSICRCIASKSGPFEVDCAIAALGINAATK
jgi:hypothetical protein